MHRNLMPFYLRTLNEGGDGGGGDGLPKSQEELNRIVQERLARDRAKREANLPTAEELKELREKAERLEKIEADGQSELTKAQSAHAREKARADELQKKLDRIGLAKEVASAKKITDPDLLVGDTREEMEAFADKLLAFRGPADNQQEQEGGGGDGQNNGTPRQPRVPGYVPTAGTGGVDAGKPKTGVAAGADWFAQTHPTKQA